MRRRFHMLDVFTDRPLGGNPLAVVLDCEGLDGERMQATAREFNLSETVFVLEARDPVNSARIRIFTPARELPFAGHPTVGTAALLAELHAPEIVARQDLALVLEEEVGLVHCMAWRIRGRPYASFVLPRLPEPCGTPSADAELAAALSLGAGDVGFDAHRPGAFTAGVPFTTVPLASPEAVDRARPDAARWPADLRAYLYARSGDGFHARMFGAGHGMAEDPATGSAAAALAGAVMAFDRPADGDHLIAIRQGVAMGRPSLIHLRLDVAGGALAAASIGGGAVMMASGTIDL